MKFRKLLIAIHSLWLATFLLLLVWWGRVILSLAHQVASLGGEVAINKLERMVLWEATTLFTLLLLASAIIHFLFWRDEKRNRSFQAFFTSLTHELRTPLASIRLQAESLIENSEQLNSSQKQLVSRLLQDSSRLETQVDRALELSRMEGGGKLHPRFVPLHSILVRAFQNLNVSLNLTNREISIFADPHALQIIFKNIIENSIKHSKSNIPRFEVQVEEITNKPFILLWVRDFGEGASIPLRQAGNLFVKGQDSSGAGVGLFLIRQLMKQMGGECTWKNDSGFWVGLKFRYE